MSIKSHSIAQILATLLQAVNLFANVVPAKYQPIVAFVIGVIQLAMALVNHYYNPDGTPASIAYVAKVLLLCLLLSGVAMGQAATPAPPAAPTPIFSVSTQAVAVRIGGSTQPGTDAIGSFNLTPNLQLQSDNILAPGVNLQAYLGGLKYYAPIFAKPLAKTSLASVTPYIHVAFGIARNVPATGSATQHYSALAGGGFDYKVNSTFSFGPRVEFFNAPGFGPHPNGAAVSANLTVVLGSK